MKWARFLMGSVFAIVLISGSVAWSVDSLEVANEDPRLTNETVLMLAEGSYVVECPVEVIGIRDGSAVAAKEYFREVTLQAVEFVTLLENVVLADGEMLFVGDTLEKGTIQNVGEHSILLRIADDSISSDDNAHFVLKPGDFLSVSATGSCSVTCRDGYYACCRAGGGCKCYKDTDTSQACDAGGPGSSSCSLSL